MKTSIISGVIVFILVSSALLIFGPQRIALANTEHGDEDLKQVLKKASQSGHNELSAFTLIGDDLRFAGIGADENTEFEIGSVTKTFTTEILRQQVESGDITLDTTVGEIIDAEGTEVADVTMLELAEHTSGLPRLDSDNLGILKALFQENPYADISQEDVFDAARNSSTDGRGEEEYSNFGVALLGQLLAVNVDSDYATLIEDNILAPAGMSDTYVATMGSVDENAPRGLAANGRQTSEWEMDGYAPAGAIRSTAADMAKYAQFIMDNNQFEYGWEPEESGGIWHNGGTGGYSTMLIVDPETDESYFVNGNTPQGVEDIARSLRSAGANS